MKERIRGILKGLSAVLFTSGAALWGYAQTLEPFNDGFQQRAYQFEESTSEFLVMREEFLTPKFAIEDYGLTLIVLAALVLVVAMRDLKSPSSKKLLAVLVLLAPLLTVFATAYYYHLSVERVEYPPADKIAVIERSFTFEPLLLTGLFLWPVLNAVLFLRKGYSSNLLREAFRWRSNWWLMLCAAFCAIKFAYAVRYGYYYDVLALAAWIYLYLSISAGQKVKSVIL